MTTTLLQQGRDLLLTVPLGTTMAPDSTAATRRAEERPRSPPQPVPRPRAGAAAHQQPPSASSVEWEDALGVAASPSSSDATEQFLDCYSEPASTGSSFEIERGALEELLRPRLSVPDTLAAAAAAVASGAGHQLAAERSRRQAAEAAAAELRRQLDEIAALVLSFRTGQPAGLQQAQQAQAQKAQAQKAQQQPSASTSGASASVASDLLGVLQAAAAQCRTAAEAAAAQAARADACAAEAEDAALVARMVASICARAAATADLEEQWAGERALFERRLDQAARAQVAMLKHQREHSTEPEPWRQQLLNTAVSVGCSILGAATAVLIIRRSQAA